MSEEKTKLAAALFPVLPPGPPGLARLAAEGHSADQGHGVEFRTLRVRSVLNRCASKRRLFFTWSINPYRGCEFGCRYCYARYTHEFLGSNDPEAFEREIYIKQHAAWLLRQELKQVRPGEEIAIGTATDPYQPIERRAQVTRSLLQVLADQQGLRVGLVTKSTLIERDSDLLIRIAARNRLTLHLTITTPDPKLARILEPRAPRPDLRFRTVQRLRAKGLRVGILCCPLMPGITDTVFALEAVARRARDAGATFFAAQPLFLKPCSRPVFLQFIEQHFPELLPHYAARYGQADFVSRAYQERVNALARAAVRKHGLQYRYDISDKSDTQPVWPMQRELWPEGRPQPQSARPQGGPRRDEDGCGSERRWV